MSLANTVLDDFAEHLEEVSNRAAQIPLANTVLEFDRIKRPARRTCTWQNRLIVPGKSELNIHPFILPLNELFLLSSFYTIPTLLQ
jgi:hypothetical protein